MKKSESTARSRSTSAELSHKGSGRGKVHTVACFVMSVIGVYARWSQMGAGDLSLLI